MLAALVAGNVTQKQKYDLEENGMKQIKNKLAQKLVAGLVLLLAACMMFTGCVQAPVPDNGDATINENVESNDEVNGEDSEDVVANQGLDSTKSGYSSNPSLIFFCDYKNEKNEFALDDVELQFFFGGYYGPDVEWTIRHTTNFPEFDIYLANDNKTHFLVRHVEENLISEKYNCEVVHDEEHRRILEVRYNYSEVIKIPKELFISEKGMVFLTIMTDQLASYEGVAFPCERAITLVSKTIFYKVEGNRVILSVSQFE